MPYVQDEKLIDYKFNLNKNETKNTQSIVGTDEIPVGKFFQFTINITTIKDEVKFFLKKRF